MSDPCRPLPILHHRPRVLRRLVRRHAAALVIAAGCGGAGAATIFASGAGLPSGVQHPTPGGVPLAVPGTFAAAPTEIPEPDSLALLAVGAALVIIGRARG